MANLNFDRDFRICTQLKFFITCGFMFLWRENSLQDSTSHRLLTASSSPALLLQISVWIWSAIVGRHVCKAPPVSCMWLRGLMDWYWGKLFRVYIFCIDRSCTEKKCWHSAVEREKTVVTACKVSLCCTQLIVLVCHLQSNNKSVLHLRPCFILLYYRST